MTEGAARPLGLAHFTVLEAPPLELVGLAARVGCAAVGLRLHPVSPGALAYPFAAGGPETRELRARLDGEGVRVHDVETVTIDADFRPAALAPVLAAARELGARRLSASGDDPDRARLVDRFAELCDLDAARDMGVDLENMGWRKVATFADALAVVRAAGRPNGGALVDALHLLRNGGRPEDVRAAPPGSVRCVQLCDAPALAPGTKDALIAEARGGRLPPGAGALPLASLLDAAPADAYLSVEVPMGTGMPAELRARAIFDATRTLLARGRERAA